MTLIIRAGKRERGRLGLAGLSRNPGICTVDYLIQGETSPCRCLDICWSGFFKARGIVRFRTVVFEKRAVKVQNTRPDLSWLSDIRFLATFIASCGKYHSTAFALNHLYCSSNRNCRKAAGKQFCCTHFRVIRLKKKKVPGCTFPYHSD